ncbi:MAG: CorA family divalent cation transporter [Candidatus Doudnabacteria bacterium]
MSLKIIHTKNLRWVDIVNPDDKDLNYLKENFKFHPLDFEDMVTPATQTKIDEYDQHHFVILLFPMVTRETGEIKSTEVDFLIGKNFLITVHNSTMQTLSNLVNNVQRYDNVRGEYMTDGPGKLLCLILELLFKRSAPILDRMNQDISNAEKNTYNLKIEALDHLAGVKKNIIIFRRIMKMHGYVLEKLNRSKKEYLKFKDSQMYFQNLIEYEENIWNMLNADKEIVESFEETNQSLSGHKMNDILRILTIFSVIIFLLTLLINILLFAESVSKIDSWPYLLPVTFLTLCTITLGMLIYFRKRKWL